MSEFDISYLTENDCEEELSIPVQIKATRKRKADENSPMVVKNESIPKIVRNVYEDVTKTIEYSNIQKEYKFIFNGPQVFINIISISYLFIFLDVSRI